VGANYGRLASSAESNAMQSTWWGRGSTVDALETVAPDWQREHLSGVGRVTDVEVLPGKGLRLTLVSATA
jgi:hypothetical protein